MCVCVCVLFYVAFNNLSVMVAACWMRRDSAADTRHVNTIKAILEKTLKASIPFLVMVVILDDKSSLFELFCGSGE